MCSPRTIAIEVYSGRTCTSSQSPGRHLGPAEEQVDDAERGEVDEPRIDVSSSHTASYSATMSRRASDDDELAAAVGAADAGRLGDERLFDGKRRRLPHLPAHQLIEILAPGRHLVELDERHLRGQVGNDERHARGRVPARSSAARSADTTAARSRMFEEVSDAMTAPGGSGSDAYACTTSPPLRSPTTAAATRSVAISTAASGGGLASHEENRLMIRRTSPC